MLELYHTGISTCSQKVRLVLAEKGLDFVSHDVNLIGGGQHDPEYVKLNPNHVVPTLVDDGHVLIESTLINEYLDEAYPDTPMKPADAVGRHALRLWTKKIDALHPNAGVITFAIGPRTLIQSQPKEVREAHITSIPDPAQRERRRSVIEHGVKAPEFAGAIARFVETLEEIETTMSKQPWLSGSDFGLADAATLPYVLRLDHLGMTSLIEARPKLADWLSRVQARPAYAVAVDAWLAEPVVTMFRDNGAAVWEEVRAVLAAG